MACSGKFDCSMSFQEEAAAMMEEAESVEEEPEEQDKGDASDSEDSEEGKGSSEENSQENCASRTHEFYRWHRDCQLCQCQWWRWLQTSLGPSRLPQEVLGDLDASISLAAFPNGRIC